MFGNKVEHLSITRIAEEYDEDEKFIVVMLRSCIVVMLRSCFHHKYLTFLVSLMSLNVFVCLATRSNIFQSQELLKSMMTMRNLLLSCYDRVSTTNICRHREFCMSGKQVLKPLILCDK